MGSDQPCQEHVGRFHPEEPGAVNAETSTKLFSGPPQKKTCLAGSTKPEIDPAKIWLSCFYYILLPLFRVQTRKNK